MINPEHQKLIQIIVTHKCPFSCAHCSQLVPHQPDPFTMSLDCVENALKTLQDYPGHIGIFGGEPLLHPQFEEICKLLQKYVPVKARRELWTMGAKWDKHKDIIEKTFYRELIAYNEHEEKQECWHQPNQIAIDDVIKDKNLACGIVDNCWVQQRWSAAVTPKGAYFCEIAAARSHLMGWPDGLEVVEGWWKRPIEDYVKQIAGLCPKCSACLPMPRKSNSFQEWDDVSLSNYAIMKDSKRPCKVVEVNELRDFYKGHTFEPETDYDKRGYFKDFPDWRPNIYRLTTKHTPEDVER